MWSVSPTKSRGELSSFTRVAISRPRKLCPYPASAATNSPVFERLQFYHCVLICLSFSFLFNFHSVTDNFRSSRLKLKFCFEFYCLFHLWPFINRVFIEVRVRTLVRETICTLAIQIVCMYIHGGPFK